MTFGERLRELRTAKGLTQEDLGKALSLDKSTISLYEAGKREPEQVILKRLADYLAVSLDYLLGRSDEPSLPVADNALPTWLSRLPPEMQEFVKEEAKHGWPYLRLARGLKMQDLTEEELRAIVETWMDAKKRYDREFRPGK